MQQLLLMLFSLMLYYVIGFMTTADCDCTELILESDCNQRDACFWQSDGCFTKTCRDYNDEEDCNSAYGCAWNSTKACSGFTLCTDYAFQNPNQCYLISTVCVPGDKQDDEFYTCKPGTLRCNAITNTSLCTPLLAQPDNRPCYFLNNECIPQDVSDCSTITNPTICKLYSCVWQNQTCNSGSCTDLKTQESCTYISTGTTGSKFVCLWQNNTCISAPDTSTFTLDNCYSNTGGSYAWINDACTKCQGKSNLILYIYVVIILLFN